MNKQKGFQLNNYCIEKSLFKGKFGNIYTGYYKKMYF